MAPKKKKRKSITGAPRRHQKRITHRQERSTDEAAANNVDDNLDEPDPPLEPGPAEVDAILQQNDEEHWLPDDDQPCPPQVPLIQNIDAVTHGGDGMETNPPLQPGLHEENAMLQQNEENWLPDLQPPRFPQARVIENMDVTERSNNAPLPQVRVNQNIHADIHGAERIAPNHLLQPGPHEENAMFQQNEENLLPDLQLPRLPQARVIENVNVPERINNAPVADPQNYNLRRRHQQVNLPQFIGRVAHPEVPLFSIGRCNRLCPHCNAKRFREETLNCCHNGKVQLNPLEPYPQEFQDLFISNEEREKNFKENIRQYNSAMAFASFGAQTAAPPGHGPYCLRIHGQIYHRSGSLHPPEGTAPSYSQLYIIEGNQAVEQRLQQEYNQNCRRDIMLILTTVLQRVNPYAAAYQHMRDVEAEEQRRAAEQNTQPATVTMCMKQGRDQRRYNEPRHDEVAVVFSSSDGAPPANRDIVVHPMNEPPTNISYMSGNCDPMVYPLLFPHGDLGWHLGLEHNPHYATAAYNKVTLLQFYSYRLAERQIFSPIHYGGKLFQQYVIDSYIKTEAARLNYIRQNQSKLRVELYKGLMDHLNAQAEEQNMNPGKVVILPSSFSGSPRAMQQNYQDAMAIVAKFGRPDLFITFTCNPKSPDIINNLPDGVGAEHRPDLVARVFKAQLQELLNDLTKKHILGVIVARVHVIEFQKRGLPHAHLLIILDNASKLRDGEDINSVICAEIPDPDESPELHAIVKANMIHGPCGALNQNSVCMKDGMCSKSYPKEFRNNTILAENGYPLYRRQDNGTTVQVRGCEVDNRWVVPYNPYLSKKFGSHINVEACTSIRSVKYLFKYIYKGHDCANIEMTERNELDHNEISTFIDARYISAPEAFWRLSEYHMHEQSHTIVRLPVHLVDQQVVYFQEGHHEDAAERAADRDTMLTAFFKLNAENKTPYCYHEIPNHYTFKSATKKWNPRKRNMNKIIARMYSVSPKDMEKFCLRLLLLHVPGPASYEDLRKVGDYTADTFKEACMLHNLLCDDTMWDRTMEESSHFQMPAKLRFLFATICAFCQPSDALQLWHNHQESMCEDFMHNDNIPLEEAAVKALQHIQSILEQHGLTNSIFGLPDVENIPPEAPVVTEQELTEANAMMAILNDQQKIVTTAVLEAVQDIQQGGPLTARAFFLDGPGGSGKTMVYNCLIQHLHTTHVNVAATAWTGIAATLLKGGRTVHNLFKLPVPILDTSTCNVSPKSKHADYLRSVIVFIIDEASMVPANALAAIDKMLQDITASKVPFGGKVMLLGGDFRQVLPVVPRSHRTIIVENCLKRSPLWPLFRTCRLTKNMRARADEQVFAEWLLQLGNGNLPSKGQRDRIQLPPQCKVVETSIIDEVFPDLSNPRSLAGTVILTPKNDDTHALNEEVLKKLDGVEKIYCSADKVICDNPEEEAHYPVEFLNSITPSGMPRHKLSLKIGAIVMLLRNLDIKRGLCNGTRLIICRLHNNILDAQILTGTYKGDRVLIPRVKLAPSDAALPFTLERTQFPVRLSYSMTINKAQGQTFEKLGIYLPAPVFSHGQLYVAFSRAKSFNDIYVKVKQTEVQGRFKGKWMTQNVVYKEVL